MILLYAALFAMFYFVTLYLQHVLGDDALQAGLAFLPMTGSVFLGSRFAPRLVGRFGVHAVAVAGMLSATIGLLLLSNIAPGARPAPPATEVEPEVEVSPAPETREPEALAA